MNNIEWKIGPIDTYLSQVKDLFSKNADHKLADNYLKTPLFEHTKFSRMGFNSGKMVYYSAGISRPQYNGSIRIMSRHTRDRNFDFGSTADDLARGLETLESSVQYAKDLGYKDIWVSRESNPKLLEYFAKVSKHSWNVTYEQLHYGGFQYVMRIING